MLRVRRAVLVVAALSLGAAVLAQESGARTRPVVIATWEFGQRANARAWAVLDAGGAALDAVEKGCNDAELDTENQSVGGGLPNEEGEVTYDAMIMDGRTHRSGAVGCLKRCHKAISVARCVMEKTRHSLLVGEDASRFAFKLGFPEATDLLTKKSKADWEAWKARPEKHDFWGHDTIGMVALDKNGDLACGCTTSGLAFKIAGRVGDSPIVGAGAYCDGEVGGAASTGNGDIMLRFLLTYQTVEFMRQGLSPRAACEGALERLKAKGIATQAAVVALNKRGETGAACTGGAPFPYAVRNAKTDEIQRAK
jgi:N4-(beta-N-acetylglucosaminyl)-L-asparaginase